MSQLDLDSVNNYPVDQFSGDYAQCFYAGTAFSKLLSEEDRCSKYHRAIHKLLELLKDIVPEQVHVRFFQL